MARRNILPQRRIVELASAPSRQPEGEGCPQGSTQKLLGALGLARRAGKLVAGFDAVCETAQKGGALLVLLCADASTGTARRVRAACQGYCPVRAIPLGQGDIAAITGKPAGVLAITNKDFKVLCLNALAPFQAGDEEEPD